MYMELQFLFSVHHLMMFYNLNHVLENIMYSKYLEQFLIYRAGMITKPIISTEHNLIKRRYMDLQFLLSAHA